MVEPNFKFKQKIFITSGFYKGYYGVIDDFTESAKGMSYSVTANLKDNQTKKLTLTEEQMRPAKTFFGM